MTPKQPRLLYIDNLRILVIALVVLHHLAITYGAPGQWPYREGQPGMITSIVYTLFTGVNQAYLMGFFFLISAYFTPGSYNRKGAGSFLRDRLLRLGIPLLFYIIVIDPLLVYALAVTIRGFNGSFWQFLTGYFANYSGFGVGPLWFVEALLIFSIIYMLWRRLVKPAANHTQRDITMPGNGALAMFALFLGLVTFIVRIWLPIGWSFRLLGLPFPYFPQYISLFVIGIIAYRRNWLSEISESMGKLWLGIATISIAVLFPILFVLGGALEGHVAPFMGGVHWQSFALAVWEQFLCMGMVISLLVWFRKKFNHQGTLAKAMSVSAYTVYIIHQPVLIVLGLSLRGIILHPLIKFIVIAPVAVSLCFLIGNYIRRLPLARSVL